MQLNSLKLCDKKNDLKFVQCLNNMAKAELTDNDRMLLRTRYFTNYDNITDAIWLYYTNKDVNERNNKAMLALGKGNIVSN
mgnify:CR=1 FL=1